MTNPDQTPAENVDVVVNPGGGWGRTKANGMAKVTVNTEAGARSLQINVSLILFLNFIRNVTPKKWET